MADSLSGFFFDVERWFGSTSAARMSFAEKGVYLVMLFQQWRDRAKSLPDTPHAVAELIAITPDQGAEIAAAWPVVRRNFVTLEREPGRIQNLAVERTRRQQRANWLRKQTAGRKAGKASAAKRKTVKPLALNDRSTTVDDRSTTVNRSDLIRSDVKREEKKDPRIRAAFEVYHRRFVALYHANPTYAGAKDAGRMKRLLKLVGLPDVNARIEAFFDSADPWVRETKHTLDAFFASGTQTKLAAEIGKPKTERQPWTCPHDPPCPHRAACEIVSMRKTG